MQEGIPARMFTEIQSKEVVRLLTRNDYIIVNFTGYA